MMVIKNAHETVKKEKNEVQKESGVEKGTEKEKKIEKKEEKSQKNCGEHARKNYYYIVI